MVPEVGPKQHLEMYLQAARCIGVSNQEGKVTLRHYRYIQVNHEGTQVKLVDNCEEASSTGKIYDFAIKKIRFEELDSQQRILLGIALAKLTSPQWMRSDILQIYTKISKLKWHYGQDVQKISRRDPEFNLTHSYYVTRQGLIFQQIHKKAKENEKAVIPPCVWFANGGFLDEGGNKKIYRLRDMTGRRRVLRGVLKDRKELNPEMLAAITCQTLKHPNLLIGRGVEWKSQKTGKRRQALITERMGTKWGSNLYTLSVSWMPKWAKVQALYQTAMGIEHCHRNGFVHRDIKGDNIFCTWNPKTGFLRVKLADFDYIEQLEKGKEYSLSLAGTVELMSPSHYLKRDDTLEKCTKSDVFSFGVTIWETMKIKQNLFYFAGKPKFVPYDREYQANNGFAEPKEGDEDFAIMHLAWEMVHPFAPKRPPMTEVVMRLGHITKDYPRTLSSVMICKVAGMDRMDGMDKMDEMDGMDKMDEMDKLQNL